MSSRTRAVIVLATLAYSLLAVSTGAHAQPDSRADRIYPLEDGIALGGFDPVSYFADAATAPSKGLQEHEFTRDGRTWRFASSQNLELFRDYEGQYEPAFGGWDAAMMAQDRRVGVDPSVFVVLHNRLYLFQTSEARVRWLQEADQQTREAIAVWNRFTSTDVGERWAIARRGPVKDYNLQRGSVGASGYDVVSYFAEGGGKPLKGKTEFVQRYRGAEYRFLNARNLERFQQRPDRFEPAYGGWCAWAMASDSLADVDPRSFIVTEDGRLLLFYKGFLNDTRAKWLDAKSDLTPDADRHWQARSKESPRTTRPGR